MEGKDLRKAGLKVTLPRLKILEILESSQTRHLSAEDIYRTLLESNEDIGLATVYRVLTQFEAAGLVTRHHFEDGMAVFELNQGTHHDHIVCLDCGRVEEFMDAGIEERQTAGGQQARLRDPRSLADSLRALPAPELPVRSRKTASDRGALSCAAAPAGACAPCRRSPPAARSISLGMLARLGADLDPAEHARELLDPVRRRTAR